MSEIRLQETYNDIKCACGIVMIPSKEHKELVELGKKEGWTREDLVREIDRRMQLAKHP